MDQRLLGVVTLLASLLLVTAIGIGLASPLILVVLTVAMIGSLALLARRASERPTEYLYGGDPPKAFKWWTVLAILLAVVYVLAAIGQLIVDPKATNVGALGIMSGFAGLIAGGLKLRSHSRIAGNWMVIFATIPALMFFWIIVPTLVALAIIVGALIEIVRATPQQPLAT